MAYQINFIPWMMLVVVLIAIFWDNNNTPYRRG